MDETTIAEMRARATAAKERINAVEEGEVDEPEFDEVVTSAAMFANDAAKLAEDVDALTKEVERLERRLGEAGEQYGMARFEEDKLRAEVERLRASREEARVERDEFGRDVERLTTERGALAAKLASLEPIKELPRDLAERVTAYVKALSETKDARPQSSRPSVYDEIRAERAAQDAKWGGPSHDDTHNLLEWVSYLFNHAARALGGHVHVRSEPAHTKPIHWTFTVQIPNGVSGAFRRQMTRVAALAVAAIESHDRAQSTAVPSAPVVTS